MLNRFSKREYGLRGRQFSRLSPEPAIPKAAKMAALQAMAGSPIQPPPLAMNPRADSMAPAAPQVPRLESLNQMDAILARQAKNTNKRF